jgi:hypothetical protein
MTSRIIGMVASALIVCGAFLSQSHAVLAGTVCLLIAPSLAIIGRWRPFIRLIVIGFMPIALSLTLAAWLVTWASAAELPESLSIRGATLILLRLLVVSGTLIWALGSSPRDIQTSLQRCGVRGEAWVTIATGLALLTETNRRAEQIITARFARGLMPNRNLSSRIFQLPFVLRTLFVWTVVNGLQRAEIWTHESTIFAAQDYYTKRIEPPSRNRDILANLIWLSVGVAILTHAIHTYWQS